MIKIKELQDNEELIIEYGFTNFDECDPNKSTRIAPTSYTNIYTDGEVVNYELNKLQPTKGLDKEEYYHKNSINAVKIDKIYIKNHSYVVTELLIDEWVGDWLIPVQKQVCIYVKDKKDFKSILKACGVMSKVENERKKHEAAAIFGEKNTYLKTKDEKVLDQNDRVHVLAKRK